MPQKSLTGSFELFSHFEDDGYMWRGNGPRSVVELINFGTSFSDNPVVFVTPSLLDCNTSAFLRYSLAAEKISPDGFFVRFETWGDSQFARVNISWLAIGEAPETDEGLWQGV